MSDSEDVDESGCPVCGEEFCAQHLIIVFADGHPHSGILADDWHSVARALKIRLVGAWLEGKRKVEGPSALTKLLARFTEFDRSKAILEVTGESDWDDPANWSEEVCEHLGLDGDDYLDREIKDIMLRVLGDVDTTEQVSHSYEKGPCVFSGNEFYASNPRAVERRFRLVLGLL